MSETTVKSTRFQQEFTLLLVNKSMIFEDGGSVGSGLLSSKRLLRPVERTAPRQLRYVLVRWVCKQTVWCYRFSAFWLRSSVVSVLISLISDMSSIRGLHIKPIFSSGR